MKSAIEYKIEPLLLREFDWRENPELEILGAKSQLLVNVRDRSGKPANELGRENFRILWAETDGPIDPFATGFKEAKIKMFRSGETYNIGLDIRPPRSGPFTALVLITRRDNAGEEVIIGQATALVGKPLLKR